jgi:hypothetical protein
VKTQRWAIPGLSVVAALAVGLTSCTQASPVVAGTATPAPTRSGLQLLRDAVNRTNGQAYQFDVAYGTALTGQGVTSGDGSATSMQVIISDVTTGIVIRAQVIVLADSAYAQINLGQLASAVPGVPPDTWVHIDPALAPGAARVGIVPGQDIFGPGNLVKGVQTAQISSNPTVLSGMSPTTEASQPGGDASPTTTDTSQPTAAASPATTETSGGSAPVPPGTIEVDGTIDLGKATMPGLPQSAATKLRPADRVVPFSALIDRQGRITTFVVQVPALGGYPASDLTSRYSNWGIVVSVSKPSPTIEAPALLYTFLS